jgi:hypothetical protein
MSPLPASAVRLLQRALVVGGRALRAAASGLDVPDRGPGSAALPGVEDGDEESSGRFRETTLWLRITKSEVRFRGTNHM